jgi:transglutaminase-like putative cysteine protease
VLTAFFVAAMAAGSALLAAALVKPAPPPVTFNIAPAPAWVKKIEPASGGTDKDTGGISYLLFDRQENVALQSSYFHEARQVTSENGVQNGAAVTVSFDPAYQELIFHSLQVKRGGTRANRLDRSQIKLFQREKDMESFLYDGAYTAQCELEDIRAGDIIEFAYTVKGTNPVLAGRYSRVFYTDWNLPVHRVITRLLYPAQRKLHFLTKNRELKPAITSAAGTTEWFSDQTGVPGRRTDADVPADYDPNGWVQISEYENWRGVVDWALPLFQLEAPLSADLQAEVAKLRQITDAEKRVLTALGVVQEQVRYLGIESGVGSHRPTSPSEVFRRRFGDCKDKALLLATLLQQCGVDAVPALVHTNFRGTVAERLPTPDDFNHAIVQVRLGDQVHWLDPTRSSQRGPLSQIYVRDLKQALVLRAGTQALSSYSPTRDSLPWKTVTENYRVPEPGERGELEVVTESHGLSAERTRSAFQESGPEKIQKQYLQYYARLFPRVWVRKTMVYEEIPDANACRTREFYSIPEIWTMNEEEKKYELTLHPGDIVEAMGTAGPSQRDDPLGLNYPAKINQVINAQMFDKWLVTAKNQTVNNAFYRFSEEAKADGRNLSFTYTYEALADRVGPSDLPTYNAGLSKIRDKLGYTLFYQKPAAALNSANWAHQLNWRILWLTAGVGLVTFILCGVYFFFGQIASTFAACAQHFARKGRPRWLAHPGRHSSFRSAIPFHRRAGRALSDRLQSPNLARFHRAGKHSVPLILQTDAPLGTVFPRRLLDRFRVSPAFVSVEARRVAAMLRGFPAFHSRFLAARLLSGAENSSCRRWE